MKFKNGYDSKDLTKNDLTQIEIVLTDFGLAEPDSKGGTPIFASPECFEKKKEKIRCFLLWKSHFISATDQESIRQMAFCSSKRSDSIVIYSNAYSKCA